MAKVPPPFCASECVVGASGLLIVGAREPGTRVVASTPNGFEEHALPFEPPRGLPVAWLDGSRFVIMGRDGDYRDVTIGGAVRKAKLPDDPVVRGLAGRFAFAVGPAFFVRHGDAYVADGPFEDDDDDIDFSALSASTKNVDVLADGPMPTAFGSGAYWVRKGGKWHERALPKRSPRIHGAAATDDGAVIACGDGGTLVRVDEKDGALTTVAHDLGKTRFHAAAATRDGLLLGTEGGLVLLQSNGSTVDLRVPGEGPVSSVSAFGDVEAIVRDDAVLVNRDGTQRTWTRLEVPDPR